MLHWLVGHSANYQTRITLSDHNDTVAGIENATGGFASDTLIGDAGPNTHDGLFEGDTITGGAGFDTLLGNTGEDSIFARDGGPDSIDCGAGVADQVGHGLRRVQCQRTCGGLERVQLTVEQGGWHEMAGAVLQSVREDLARRPDPLSCIRNQLLVRWGRPRDRPVRIGCDDDGTLTPT